MTAFFARAIWFLTIKIAFHMIAVAILLSRTRSSNNPTQFSSNQRNSFSKYFHQCFCFNKLFFYNTSNQQSIVEICSDRLSDLDSNLDEDATTSESLFFSYQKRFGFHDSKWSQNNLISLLAASFLFLRLEALIILISRASLKASLKLEVCSSTKDCLKQFHFIQEKPREREKYFLFCMRKSSLLRSTYNY